MSRVKKPNKYMNTNKYSKEVTNTSKMTRIKGENADATKARSLTDWLFLKYDMTYKAYRRKSKSRRDELREEYVRDTGNELKPAGDELRSVEDEDEFVEPGSLGDPY